MGKSSQKLVIKPIFISEKVCNGKLVAVYKIREGLIFNNPAYVANVNIRIE